MHSQSQKDFRASNLAINNNPYNRKESHPVLSDSKKYEETTGLDKDQMNSS